jgi:hypothetical protein
VNVVDLAVGIRSARLRQIVERGGGLITPIFAAIGGSELRRVPVHDQRQPLPLRA